MTGAFFFVSSGWFRAARRVCDKARMNIALWLERAGKSHVSAPALGVGNRVLRSYAETALRVSRLAGALRSQLRLNPGDRVAIAAKNSADYFETLYAVWHAGLAAVPANAKLHGAELGYILEHSGRGCVLRRRVSMPTSRRMRRNHSNA
jgi:acyl-CoA synthetase (AMP-forming)/AMP-acid ligase II